LYTNVRSITSKNLNHYRHDVDRRAERVMSTQGMARPPGEGP
jgi:hypothetical protein